MKKLFILLVPVLALTAGCTAIKPENKVNATNSTVAANANTNAAMSISLHTTVPSGWESVSSPTLLLELRRADPIQGYRESEVVYPNEGYFTAQLFTAGTSAFTESETLLHQTEKRTIVGDTNFPLTNEVTSEEAVTIAGLKGKRYFISSSTQDKTTNAFIIETVLQYDDNTIISMQGAYGDGSDSAQLKADVLAIQDSLTITK